MNIKSLGQALERRIKRLFNFWLARLLPSPGGPRQLDLSSMHSILVLRPDRLGDFILAIPAISALEHNLPSAARLTLVVGSRSERLARLFFPRARVLAYYQHGGSLLKILFILLCNRFDAVVDLHSWPFSTTTALMALASRAVWRIGFKNQPGKESLAAKVYAHGSSLSDENLHEKEKNCQLMASLGIPQTELRDASFPRGMLPTSIVLQATGILNRIPAGARVVGLHPTLAKQDNRWSQDNYRGLIRSLQLRYQAWIVIIHGLGEENELDRFLSRIGNAPGVLISPDADVLLTLALAGRFDVFIGNDCGLLHLAAMRCPLVAIWGPSDPGRWAPLGPEERIILRTPDQHCDSVKIPAVLDAVDRIFNYQSHLMPMGSNRTGVSAGRPGHPLHSRQLS